MKLRIPALLLLALTAWGQEEQVLEPLALRVSSVPPIVVDRGERDGVHVGDRVTLTPRTGGSYDGTVVSVDERSSVVELDDKTFVPAPGTKGEVRVTRAPGEQPTEDEPTEDSTDEPGESSDDKPDPDGKWTNKDKDWSPDKPLLAGRPLRPNQRPSRWYGRVYGVAELVSDIDDYTNSFMRVGTDMTYTNLMRRGGRLRLNTELAYLEDVDDDKDVKILLRQLSYSEGDHRFSRDFWEVGRFLQSGLPEFGTVDGGEWIRRRENGHRFGVAVGALPEPDQDFDSFTDWGISGFYEWVSDPREQLVLTGGYQKTWHGGEADRDLLVGKFRYVPQGTSWDVFGSVWVDVYTGKDDEKGSGLDLTQVILNGRRQWRESGIELRFTHIRFPEILRNGKFLAGVEDLSDRRADRLTADYYYKLGRDLELQAHLGVWNDEETTGGDAELGVEIEDLWLKHSTASITGIVNFAEFENVFGGRVTYGQSLKTGRWDVLYEIANHHLLGFPSDRDDMLQQRFRLSGSYYTKTNWDFSAYAQFIYWDEEFTWTLGFSWQKRF